MFDDYVIFVGERILLFRKEIISVIEEGIYICKKSSMNGKGEIIVNIYFFVECKCLNL